MTGRRALGLWTALALVVGNTIGSGIYLLPATLAPFGGNAMIGWLVTIAGALCLAFVFASLAAKLPAAGGPYAYAAAAFGPAAGFFVAWSYWVLVWAGNGAVAAAVISALAAIFPVLGNGAVAAALALALLWLTVAVNMRGVALAGRVQLVAAVLKIVPLVGVIVIAAVLVMRDGGAAMAASAAVPIAPGAIAGAAAITFFGFIGLESATVPADRVENPARIVPLVTLAGTTITGVIYVAVAGAIMLLMPATVTAASPAPVADFLSRHLGGGVGAAVAVFAAISSYGALNGFVLLQGEMPRAMARGGVFPRWFAQEGRRGTPVRAHLVSGVLASAVLLLNYTGKSAASLFADLAAISLAAGMLAYLASALAAVRLLRAPAPRVAGAVSAVFVAWLVWGLGAKADLWGIALLLAGLPVFLASRRA